MQQDIENESRVEVAQLRERLDRLEREYRAVTQAKMNGRGYVTSRKFLWAASVVAIFFFAVGLLSGDAGKSLFISDKGYVGLNTQEPKSLLDVNGDIRAGNSTLFFTQTAHNWNAVGDPVGWASIQNSDDLKALIISGRNEGSMAAPKRIVKFWDRVGIVGTPSDATFSPEAALDVRGDAKISGGVTLNNGLFAPGATEEKLRIVRGIYIPRPPNGNVTQGKGFTVTYIHAGNYKVTFDPGVSFSELPAIFVTAFGSLDLRRNATVYDMQVNESKVLTEFKVFTGSLAEHQGQGQLYSYGEDLPFSLLVIGPTK